MRYLSQRLGFLIAAEAAEVADRVRNEVAVERGDAFRRLLTMIIATRVASGLVDVEVMPRGWSGVDCGGVISLNRGRSQCWQKEGSIRVKYIDFVGRPEVGYRDTNEALSSIFCHNLLSTLQTNDQTQTTT